MCISYCCSPNTCFCLVTPMRTAITAARRTRWGMCYALTLIKGTLGTHSFAISWTEDISLTAILTWRQHWPSQLTRSNGQPAKGHLNLFQFLAAVPLKHYGTPPTSPDSRRPISDQWSFVHIVVCAMSIDGLPFAVMYALKEPASTLGALQDIKNNSKKSKKSSEPTRRIFLPKMSFF